MLYSNPCGMKELHQVWRCPAEVAMVHCPMRQQCVQVGRVRYWASNKHENLELASSPNYNFDAVGQRQTTLIQFAALWNETKEIID